MSQRCVINIHEAGFNKTKFSVHSQNCTVEVTLNDTELRDLMLKGASIVAERMRHGAYEAHMAIESMKDKSNG